MINPKEFPEKGVIEHMDLGKYITQSPIESETASEALTLFREIDWNNAKERLEKCSARMTNYLSLAAAMCQFDTKRFNEEIQISDEQWKDYVGAIEEERNHSSLHFLRSASLLKEINPERFKEDVKIDDGYWDEVAEKVKNKRNNLQLFVCFYEMAHSINPQETQERIPIDENYWEKIGQEIEYMGHCPQCQARIASAAQRIKPEGLPDIIISREQWKSMIDELSKILENDTPAEFVFNYANKLKNVKVEQIAKKEQ